MKKIFLLLIVFCSCNETEIQESKLNYSTEKEEIVTNNPCLYNGSSFGDYFQALYRLGNYSKLICIIDSTSRNRNGDSFILNYFKTLDFSFDLKLKSKTNEESVIWLNYEANINATRKTFRLPVVIENDSCKVRFDLFVNQF